MIGIYDMWEPSVDPPLKVAAALLNYCQHPAQEYALEHVFPALVPMRDYTCIKEYGWL